MWIMDFLVINNIFNSVACIAKRSIASELLEGHKIRDRYKKNYADWIEIRIKMRLRVMAHIRFADSERNRRTDGHSR